jgi:hypothetical protein
MERENGYNKAVKRIRRHHKRAARYEINGRRLKMRNLHENERYERGPEKRKRPLRERKRACGMKVKIKNISMAAVLFIMVSAGTRTALAAPQPKVEVVFCLDTTGSMSGLIEGAKQKIWSIANQIVSGNPTPELSIGLVGYRDYGDAYITRVFDLDNDLDAVFDNLMSFSAAGGGDTPEHVNRALNDAVHEINWDKNPKTLKLIFLVGDCPPHMDYRDGYDYREICRDAVKRDIVINAVQCGDHPDTVPYWRDIARRGEGRYAMIPQEGGMQVIETPYDEELSRLNLTLEGTVVPFGSAEKKAESKRRKKKLSALAPSVAAERAAYKSTESGIGAYDLIDALKSGSVTLVSVRDGELPAEMQGMNKEEKEAYIAKKEQERQQLKLKIQKLNEQRERFIADAVKKSDLDSFDEVVAGFIADQAEDKGIRY